MIVDSMTREEVIKQFNEDKPNYQNKLASFIKSFSSLILHSKSFPLRRLYLYTTPKTRNSYLFSFEAQKRGGWKTPKFKTVLLFNYTEGQYALLSARSELMPEIDCYIVYSPHFFSRYRERVLKDDELTTAEVMSRFFYRNPTFNLNNQSEKYSKRFEKHSVAGRTPYVLEVEDGMCFGDAVYHNTMMVKTIISREMLSKSQLDALDKDLPDKINGLT